MKNYNLAEWALKHRQLVGYFVVVVFLAGIFSYMKMGRMEDPDFVIRQMVVSVAWPGASARQVEEQVTEKIERKLQETPGLKHVTSQSRSGQAIIFVELEDAVPEQDVRPTWLEVRNLVQGIALSFPAGIVGPFFDDRFDDVYGSIYAVTGEGFNYEELRVHSEKLRRIFFGVHAVKKVVLIGTQPEKITIGMNSLRMAQLGISPREIMAAVNGQNAVAPAGMIDTVSDNLEIRVSGPFGDVDAIRALSIRGATGMLRLGDIARVTRGYAEPPEPGFYYNGRPAIAVAVAMEKGGNVLELGENLGLAVARTQKEMPLGLAIEKVSDQPQVVADSIDEFIKSLAEAILIVLAICFLSLGLRSGFVVALCIPLVILAVFLGMSIFGIDLHKVSLGSLIIALGLLVDDAIIIVEMMANKLEQGWNRDDAAKFAYGTTAFPMLTGTLVTAAGFIPVSLGAGSASEFTSSIFFVVLMALVISWLVAALVAPLLGHKLLVVKKKSHDLYATKFYNAFRQGIRWCLGHRVRVIVLTVGCFAAALLVSPLVKTEFFPESSRPELLVELRLPEGASLAAAESEAKKFCAFLKDDRRIKNYTHYVGQGMPRFVLTIDPAQPAPNLVQFVIVAASLEDRIALRRHFEQIIADRMPGVRGNIRTIQTGPPDPYPVAFRVSGPDPDGVRRYAEEVRGIMATNKIVRDINLDWNEKNKTLRLEVDQDKARALGIDSQNLALALQMQVSGIAIGEYRHGDRTIAVDFRMDASDRRDPGQLRNLSIPLASGKSVPLEQIAHIRYDAEAGLIKRRDLKPTILVQANVAGSMTGNDVTQELFDRMKPFRDKLPVEYSLEVAGPLEQTVNATGPILAVVPLMLFVMVTLLMLQLQNVARVLMTLLTAPLGLIGVIPALLLTGSAIGFVVQVGVLALIGIIIRNSVILIDQIEQRIAAGSAVYDAIVDSTVMRFRPIMLTAAAAVMGMIPLMFSSFWGPMAIAISGGLLVATVLTLVFLPALYAVWYGTRPVEGGKRV